MNRTVFQLSLGATALAASMAAATAQVPDPPHAGAPAAAPAAGAPGAAGAATMPMTPSQAGMPMPGAGGQAGNPMGGDMGRMMGMMRPMAGGMGMPFEHVEGRIAYLKAELKVTDAQSAPWNAFAATMRANAAAMKTMHEGMGNASMPTTMPDRMVAQRKLMSARMAMMDHSETSMKALYAALSTEQRRSFDQMMSGPMGMM